MELKSTHLECIIIEISRSFSLFSTVILCSFESESGSESECEKKYCALSIIFNDLDDVKYALIEFMLEGIINPKDLDSHICLFKKKLIQIENAPHRKGKRKLLRTRKKGINVVPDEFFTYFAIKNEQRESITQKISSIKQPF